MESSARGADLPVSGIWLAPLDRARARVLRRLDRIPGWRRLFTSRAARSLTVYVFAFAVLAVAALFIPLWMAALSPLIWGSAHLLASLRFSSELMVSPVRGERSRFSDPFLLLLAASLIAAGARLFTPLWWPVGGEYGLLLLLVAALSVTLGFRRCRRRGPPTALFVLGLGVLLGLAPFATLAVLAFGHHAQAFVVWGKSASSRSERQVVAIAFVMFVAFHGFLFAGVFDGAAQFTHVDFAPAGSLWDFVSLSALSGYDWQGLRTYHFAVAFVFGQSLHYMIWLKLIPEARLAQAIPRNFRQSYRDWRARVGVFPLALALLGPLGLGMVWFFAGLAVAQTVYLAGAAFHGYGEILALVAGRRPS